LPEWKEESIEKELTEIIEELFPGEIKRYVSDEERMVLRVKDLNQFYTKVREVQIHIKKYIFEIEEREIDYEEKKEEIVKRLRSYKVSELYDPYLSKDEIGMLISFPKDVSYFAKKGFRAVRPKKKFEKEIINQIA